MPLQIFRTNQVNTYTFLRMLMAGTSGAGKTRFISSFRNPLVATSEGLLMSLAREDIAAVNVTSIADLWALIDALDQPPELRKQAFGLEVDTVSFDTLDEFQRMYQRERLATTGRETFGRDDYGWLGDRMAELLSRIRNLPLHVICTVHISDREIEGAGRSTQPMLVGRTRDEITSYFDIVMRLDTMRVPITGADGMPDFETHFFGTCSRDEQYEWLKDHSGRIPRIFEVDFKTDFDRIFDTVYDSDLSEMQTQLAEGAVPPDPATEALRAGEVVPEVSANPDPQDLSTDSQLAAPAE